MAELIRIVDLLSPKCANTFGVAPCTATGPAGSECYNTFGTCQDLPNYDQADNLGDLQYFTYRFSATDEYDSIPSLIGSNKTPSEINLVGANPDNGAFGRRAKFKATIMDHPYSDYIGDPYLSTRTYDPESQGTFWGKYLARNAAIKNTRMVVYDGEMGQNINDMIRREYLVESIDGPVSSGQVSIVAKDPLRILLDETVPKDTGAYVYTAIPAGTNIFTLVFGTYDERYDTEIPFDTLLEGNDPNFYYFSIAGEQAFVQDTSTTITNIGTDPNTGADLYSFTNVTWKTLAAGTSPEIKVGDPVYRAQVSRSSSGENVAAMFRRLIGYRSGNPEFSRVPARYYDLSEWQTNLGSVETDGYYWEQWEPEKVDEVCAKVAASLGFIAYWNDQDSKIKLEKYQLPKTAILLGDDDLIEGSMIPTRSMDEQITRYIFENVTGSAKYASINLDKETEYNTVKRVEQLNFTNNTAANALSIANAYRDDFEDGAFYVEFSLDRERAEEIWTGSKVIFLGSRFFQGADGAPLAYGYTIISATIDLNKGQVRYRGVRAG